MEQLGVEGSLDLWTLERDHTRYVTLSRGCGRLVFSPASFEAMQLAFGENSSGGPGGGAFPCTAQSRTCCQRVRPAPC